MSALLSLSDVIVLLSFPSSELHVDMDFDQEPLGSGDVSSDKF